MKIKFIVLFLFLHIASLQASNSPTPPLDISQQEEDPSPIRSKESFMSAMAECNRRERDITPRRRLLQMRMHEYNMAFHKDKSILKAIIIESNQWGQDLKEVVDKKQEAFETALDHNLLTDQDIASQQHIIESEYQLARAWATVGQAKR